MTTGGTRRRVPMPVASVALGLGALVCLASGCSAPVEQDTTGGELDATAVASATAVVAQLPQPEPDAMPEAAVRATITDFVQQGTSLVASGADRSASACQARARQLDQSIPPDALFTAAGQVRDPELRAFVLTARQQVGVVLGRCADPAANSQTNSPDDQQARSAAAQALALVQARLAQVTP